MTNHEYDLSQRADDYLHQLLSAEEAKEFADQCEVSIEYRMALDEATQRHCALNRVSQLTLPESLIASTMAVICVG